MVAVHVRAINASIFQLIFDGIADRDIIDAPAFVPCSGACSEAPPGIVMRFLIEMSETIGHASIKPSIHPFAFFRQKAAGIFVANRIMDIDGFVTDIIVATNNEFFRRIVRVINEIVEGVQEFVLHILADISGGTGREVATHDIVAIDVCGDHSAFGVEKFMPHAGIHSVRFDFRKNANTTIAFFLCREKIAVVSQCF